MHLANQVWVISKDVAAHESIVPAFTVANVEAAKEGAKASQRQDAPGLTSMEDNNKKPECNMQLSASVNDVRYWLQDIRVRKNDKGRRVLNDSQLRVVERVVTRLR